MPSPRLDAFPDLASNLELSSMSSAASSSSSSPPRISWRTHKERGKDHFSAGRYHESLASYRAALAPWGDDDGNGGAAAAPIPDAERQVLLSNVVACRLKIVQESPRGSLTESERRIMCESAVEEAKECVALNDRWAKGHVRLASAYIASGDASNDACNSLQRALALDPSNAAARQMLMRELRRDRDRRNGNSSVSGGAADASASASGGRTASVPSAPPFEGMQDDVTDSVGGGGSFQASASAGSAAAPSAPPPDDYVGSPTADYTNSNGPPAGANANANGVDAFAVDDSPSLTERAQFYLARLLAWWEHDLSEDMRTLAKVLLGLLVIYIALGGRFGLDSALGGGGGRGDRGSYEPGESAYDRYYGRGSASSSSSSSTGYNDRSTGRYSSSTGYDGRSTGGGYSTSYDSYGRRTSSSSSTYDDYTYNPQSHRRRSTSSSHHMPDLFDGSVASMVLIAVIAYACHHFGINPFHALMMVNVVTGNRNRGMHRMGMMGMGYGMMRNNMGGWGGRRGGFRRGG